jgi:protein YibB
MDKSITIVTAFFRINRSSWQGFERSDEQYFEHFKVWARVKNKLVVYVESEELKQLIVDFRKSLLLEDRTIVYVVSNCLFFEPQLFNSLKATTDNPIQRDYRLLRKNPEVWNATYNYVMLLKAWCVCDAIQRGVASGMVAWLDFGYNHGGDPIDKGSDFNFEWTYDFPEKINLFTIQDLDNRPIFDIVLSMDTYIMGGVIIGIDKLWEEFWGLVKQSVYELTNCGLVDDDQNIMLMAYRKKPELFALHKSYWSVQMKQFGGGHLQWSRSYLDRTTPSFKNRIRAIIKWYKHKKNCFLYAIRVYKHLSKIKVH